MRKSSASDQSPSQVESQSESPQLAHLAPLNQQQSQPSSMSNPSEHIRSNINSLLQPPPEPVRQQEQVMMLPNPVVNRLMVRTEERPRLIIDRIVLENFKSYADVQTIGPFHQNFTSVVGPNGSGKSNLIECMLFIFGYKANWMRLNRLNQLIHNSSTMSNVEKASVQVHFKKIIQTEDNKIQQIPNTAFSIKRTVKTTGVSKYHINQQQSTQSQVKQLLQKQGIDLNNNRFLILQGEVQQISQMKQKSGDREKPGLLEYLEDIIGSNNFIEQIEKSVTQYNAIEETKHEKGELMKLSEIELKGMNKGKQQAIKYVKKQRQIYQVHNILQQVIISNNKYQVTELSHKLHKAELEKERIISEQKQKLKKQAERIRQIKKNRVQIDYIEKQLQKQNDIMTKMSTTDKNINQEISFKSEDLVKYNRKNNDYDAELSKIISESTEVKQELPNQREKLDKLKAELDGMEEQLIKYDKPELKTKLKSLQTELKKIQHEIKTFSEKQKQVKKTHDLKFKNTEKSEIQKVELEHKLEQQAEVLQKISHAEVEANKIKQSLTRQLQQLSQKRKQHVQELDQISVSLKEQQYQHKQMGIFNDMFDKIMQQNIPGVIGRLGDLGTVPKQYDEIITSCCSRLDNIVVRDMEAASAVLSFLKNTKLGRVTCIILDKIQDQRKYMERPYQKLANSVRLFDIITPQSEDIRIAFYFAISDTIYCENSQLGMEYSMKDERNRRRVVSKKPGGYIIYELNGLMNGCLPKSGGFTVRAKSKMRKQGVDTREIKDMEKLKGDLNEKIAKLQERYRNVKKQFEGVQKDQDQFKRQRRKIQNSITQTKQQLTELQKSTNNNTKVAEQQKQKMEKQLESLARKIKELESQQREITNQIKSIENQQRSNQTEKITRLRDSYKISKQEYILLDKDIQKKVAILETSIKRVEENKKNKADIAKKIDMLNRQIQKLQKQREQIQIKAADTFNKIKKHEQKIEKCKKQQEELKVLFDEEEKQVRQSKIKIERAKQEVDQCRQKIEIYNKNVLQAEEELKKQRETYRELSATYDFLDQIEMIQYMSVEEVKKNADGHTLSKGDTSVVLNTSIDSNNTSMSKVFPLERLLQISPFDNLSEEKLDQFLLFTDKLRTMLVTESENLKKMSGNNLQIISEFRNKFSDFKKKHEEFEAVKNSQMLLKKKIEQLKKQRLECFIKGFSIINSKLKEVYQLLTRGGDAQLELTDSLDPFSDGITFSVRPPKKAWKQINKLSGGEKTLSSLSLIFALHYFKPTPLYFMDEIDAALDFKNVSIVADYIKKRTKDAQFIIISLRNNMFELADKLVGVYKTYDKTKIIHFVPSKMRKNPTAALQKQNEDYNKNR